MPAENVLNINLRNNQVIAQVEIIDLVGKIRIKNTIRNNAQSHIEMNIAQLTKGMYICRIKSGNNILITKKFIKK